MQYQDRNEFQSLFAHITGKFNDIDLIVNSVVSIKLRFKPDRCYTCDLLGLYAGVEIYAFVVIINSCLYQILSRRLQVFIE